MERPKHDRHTLVNTVRHVIERRMLVNFLRYPRHFVRHYLSNSNKYLFDLEAAPGEQHNLAAERPDLVSQFRRVLERWQQQNEELAQ